jgi:DNA repair protein RadC
MRIYEAKLVFNLVSDGPAERLNTAPKVAAYLAHAFDENPLAEQVIVIFLNRRNYPLGYQRITTGTLTNCLVHPREVLRAVLKADGASAFLLAHNHPGGDPTPSGADATVTRQLYEAAKAVDIPFIDHLILGEPSCDPCGLGHYSFRSAGLL